MWTVRKALMLIFLAVVTVPLGLVWLWPQFRIMEAEIAEGREENRVVATVMSRTIGRYFGTLSERFEAYGEEILNGKPRDSSLPVARERDFRFVALVDLESGKIVSGVAGHEAMPRRDLDHGVLSALLRSAKALPPTAENGLLEGEPAATPGTAMPPARYAVDRSERNAIAIGAPLAAFDPRPSLHLVQRHGARVLVGVIDPARVEELMKDIAGSKTWLAALVSADGQAYALTLPIGGEKSTFNLTELENGPSALLYGGGLVRTAGGDKFVVGYQSVAGATGWGVAIIRPLSALQRKSLEHHRSSILIFAMALIGAALVGFRSGLVLVEPLRVLIAAVRRMEQGESNVRIAAPGPMVPREIATLAGAFNRMAESVEVATQHETEARLRAEKASEQKSEVLRYVTHEMRSPANAILGFAQLLAQGRQGPLGAPAYEGYARDILSGSRHLLSLINDLLDLSKIEAGKYELHDEPIGLDEIVDRAVRYVQPVAAERGTVLHVEYCDSIPTVIADERALFQIMLNLVNNAVRYGREAGITTVRCHVNDDGGIELAVVDDGPGIAPENLEKVLEPFHRIECAQSRRMQGTGLGLPIVKRLIELHGGNFVIESEVEVGTTCRIILPPSRTVPLAPETKIEAAQTAAPAPLAAAA